MGKVPKLNPNFEAPPINEVVCGVVFERLSSFTAPFVGLLWDEYRADFPKSQPASLLISDETKTLTLEEFQFPRIWFVHKDERTLIQVQNDRLLFNWRKVEPGDAYPRFTYVIKEFREHFEHFNKFISKHDLGVLEVKTGELSYINHIPAGEDYDLLADIGRMLPDVSWQRREGRFLPTPKIVTWRALFELPNGKGTLTAKVDTGRRKTDNREILVLDLTARGPLIGSVEAMWEWFRVAHDWIVQGFADLTDPKVQTEIWKRIK